MHLKYIAMVAIQDTILYICHHLNELGMRQIYNDDTLSGYVSTLIHSPSLLLPLIIFIGSRDSIYKLFFCLQDEAAWLL